MHAPNSPRTTGKIAPFLTGIFPKTVGVASSSSLASVSKRQNRLMLQDGYALCTRVSTGDKLEVPRATRGQL